MKTRLDSRTVASIVRSLVLVGLLGARAASAQHGLPILPPIKIDLVRPVTIPMRIFDQTRPGVEVMINGRGPYLFAIETGGPYTIVLDAKVSAALQLKPLSGAADPLRSIESLQIGPLSLHNVTVFVRDGTGLTGVDGMLGLSMFKEVLLTVDFPRRQVRLERDSLPATNGRDVIPLHSRRHGRIACRRPSRTSRGSRCSS